MDKPNYVKWIALGLAWAVLLRNWFGPSSSEVHEAERLILLMVFLAAYFIFDRQDSIYEHLHSDNMSLISALSAVEDKVSDVEKRLRRVPMFDADNNDK